MLSINWQQLLSNLSFTISVAYAVTIVFIVLLITLENRSPLKSISWILIITLVPVFGMLFYIFFGQKYRIKRKYSRKEARYQQKINRLSEAQLRQLSNVNVAEINPRLREKKDIMTLLLRSDRAFLSRNHSVQLLKNGSQTFYEIKKALRDAQHHIHLEFYIFRFDQIGNELFEILKQKAAEGVIIRIIYDSVGSYKMSRKKKKEAIQHGIELKSFQKVYFPLLSSKVNYRNHRKIVIIDGKTGFTGGLNISEKYDERRSESPYWRDTFVKIEGKSVAALQSVFINDWFYVTRKNIFSEEYFVELPDAEQYIGQIISSGPDSRWQAISQFYFSAITTAREHVYIGSPYFIPNDELSFALKAAALRGIDVRILIPEKPDSIVSRWTTESYIGEMLKAGVKIYRYRKGFYHSKVLIADGTLCSIGSANLDYRSLETNFEVCAVFYDENISARLSSQYLDDLKDAVLLSLYEWQKRKWYLKLVSSFARLFAPLM